jgi:two-component system sensor histidine kinase RegB
MSEALAMTEMALLREQKLSALDGLAAAAAHELGTPLGTIAVVAKELMRDLPKNSKYREDVELLRSQSDRCREILTTLTRTSGEEDSLTSHATLTQVLEEVVAPYVARGKTVVVEGRNWEDSPEAAEPVTARNPGILYGLGNLVENAVDFAERNVTVTAVWDDTRVGVTIVDDGPGFSAAVLERLGEPYVTSRPVSGADETFVEDSDGLGLGFFIAKTLLERSGAKLEIKNRKPPDPGAMVKIVWPRSDIEMLVAEGNHIL